MRKLSVLLMAAVLGGCTSEAKNSRTLRFSAIPDQGQSMLKQRFDRIAEYLGNKLGIEVEYAPSSDYTASVEAFKNGDIQLAWFGGLTGCQARAAVPGAHAIVKGDSDAEFVSYFIAHKDAGLEPSDEFPMDMAGKKFTFGSQVSTSGRLMPEHFIRKHTGKSPDEFLGQVGYSGNHDNTAKLVESGQYDVGALNFKVYERRVKDGNTDSAVCRVIWKTPPYADYNFTAHPDLEKLFGEGFTEKLKSVLLEMTDPELLQAFPREKLIPASDEEFEGIRKTAEKLDMLN